MENSHSAWKNNQQLFSKAVIIFEQFLFMRVKRTFLKKSSFLNKEHRKVVIIDYISIPKTWTIQSENWIGFLCFDIEFAGGSMPGTMAKSSSSDALTFSLKTRSISPKTISLPRIRMP